MNIRNKKGTALIVTYMVVAVLLVLGAAFAIRSLAESRLAERHKKSNQAFSIAEAGLELALYRLRMDFESGGASPSWRDGTIDTVICGPNTVAYYTFLGPAQLGDDLFNGTYTVELRNVTGMDDEIWVRSTGTVGDITKIIETYLKIVDEAPWNNVVFGGSGQAGALISGNVEIGGSIHILGDGLLDTDFAINLVGGPSIANNYKTMDADLVNKVPPCPTRMFNGEMVEYLDAEVRIKQGKAGLSGASQIGEADSSGDAFKETMEGVYISDGYGGNQGDNNVYSDNGKYNLYDLGDEISFLHLSDPYGTFASYQEFLKANALVINDPAQITELENITPNSVFNYADADGSISMDGAGNMTISGIVYIDGGGLGIKKLGNDKTITYTGQGSILATEDVNINVNLYTPGNNSFPTNILGVMTPKTINFLDMAGMDVMGLFYAQDKITCAKQTNVAGAFISNYFDMGSQVPSIYQVPSVTENLPPGMINADPIWVNKIVLWRQLQ
ncbi:MAG: hypothetical protein JW869_03850 [Candidatus Omnitrophica bacterium]|nr:hypothetical protein [Candidatus Omnitrophota bacterium]